MHNFPPNVDPKISTLSAVVIGFALIDHFTAGEQNALGNWFITIGQILENNSAFQQVIESRIQGSTININSQKFEETGDPYMDNEAWAESPSDKQFNDLKKTVDIMKEELDKLRK